MRTSQESEKHQQQEYRVGRRNSGGANYAAMCVRGEAHLEFWVILPSNLFIPSTWSVSSLTPGAKRGGRH